MNQDQLQVGQAYPGEALAEDGALFEFSNEGPELRLFFSRIPQEAARAFESEDCYLGLMRAGEVAVVPWQIGDRLIGDAQFHVYRYPPQTRPSDILVGMHERIAVRIVLIDRDSREVRALRRVLLSKWFSQELSEAVSRQLANRIGREEYDAQIGIYQSKYADVREAIAAADIFEKVEG
jgi:hypothetical protein